MDSDSIPPSSSFQFPIINFSDKTLKPGNSKWDEVKTYVRKALEDYGCFEASFDKVSTELKKTIYKTIDELFELPIQTKQRNKSSKPLHGYLSHNLYQSFGIDDANVFEKVNEFTQQLLPDHKDKSIISEAIHQYAENLSELDMMVRRMIMESFGIEKYVDEHLNSTDYILRMMKYTTPLDANEDETMVGLRSHTDKNTVTILHQHQVDGLEVMTKDETWIKVKPSHDSSSFIVMAGDCLSALLNGRVLSPHHRVMMMGKKIRYSTALFSVPKTGVIIDSPEELVDEEHPRLFKPYEHDEFIRFFHSEAGRRAQSPLHAFAAL